MSDLKLVTVPRDLYYHEVAYVRSLELVVQAARNMPRETPKAGAASTVHDFKIEAAHVWQLDRALKQLDFTQSSAQWGEHDV